MKRVVPGILIALIWLLLLLKGSATVFAVVLGVVACFAADEYGKMAGIEGLPLYQRVLLDVTMVLPLFGAAVAGNMAAGAICGLFAAFVVLTLHVFTVYADTADPYGLFCRIVFGIVYVGVLSSFLVMLRNMPEGNAWLLVLTAITAGSDTGAYYVGRAFGKNKLCPSISPNKTREGAWGGFLCGTVSAAVFAGLFLNDPQWSFIIPAAALLTLFGIAGDLTESVIKRGTGVKDSGHCLGGHGGILDRIDSLLFCAPVLYCLLAFAK